MLSIYQSFVFEPLTNTWSTWPAPLLPSEGGCMVQWKDYFFLFGGFPNFFSLQKFNLLTQTWEIVSKTSAPYAFALSNCAVLPNNKIYVASGSGEALFDPDTNTWEKLLPSGNDIQGASFVTLSGRVFVLQPHLEGLNDISGNLLTTETQEFDFDTYTWLLVDAKIPEPINLYRTAISLPPRLFEHLPGGCVGI